MAQETNRRPVRETGRQRRTGKSSDYKVRLSRQPFASNNDTVLTSAGSRQVCRAAICNLVTRVSDGALVGPPWRHSSSVTPLTVLWRSEVRGQLSKTSCADLYERHQAMVGHWLPIFSARLLVTVGARSLAAKLLWDEIQWGAGSLTLTLDRRAFFPLVWNRQPWAQERDCRSFSRQFGSCRRNRSLRR